MCSVNKCMNMYSRRGFCAKHYTRWYRHGDPLMVKKITNHDINCIVENCEEKYYCKGYCGIHFGRWKKHGDPLYNVRIMDSSRICKVDECNDKYESKGYCQKHYVRFKKHGDPLKISIIMDPNRGCKVNECNEKHSSIGYCGLHYRQWFRKTYPEKLLKNHIRYIKKCAGLFDMSHSKYGHANTAWSNTIKKNDDYICKICGVFGTSKTLIAHHILYRHKYPEKSLDIDNGVTLCEDCHKDFHHLNGWRQ